jgi:hypothetical protein
VVLDILRGLNDTPEHPESIRVSSVMAPSGMATCRSAALRLFMGVLAWGTAWDNVRDAACAACIIGDWNDSEGCCGCPGDLVSGCWVVLWTLVSLWGSSSAGQPNSQPRQAG